MFLKSCKNMDKVSELISDPAYLITLLLAKNRRVIRSASGEAKSIANIVSEVIRSASENELVHHRLTVMGAVYRVFTLKDVVIATLQENEIGQAVKYGAEALQDLSKILESNIAVSLFIESIPIPSIDPGIAKHVKACLEEIEKAHIAIWRKKGLYGLAIEELISDKGSYTYVLKVRDANMNTYALKVLKEDVAINRSFMDIIRGYVYSFAVHSLEEKELEDLAELKGYDKNLLKELLIYKNYISPVKALLVLRDRLNKEDYVWYPPGVLEEYASLGDLESYAQKQGIKGLAEAMYITIRIAGATALAHLMNIVHLDIKPKNILLFQDEHSRFGYVPKLTDFSGALGDPTHGYKFARITPGYADPLALVRGFSDLSFDVYSIVMVLAYMISNTVPRHRLILNIVLLQNLYGYPIPMERIGDEDMMLKDFARKVLDATLQLRSKVISYQDFVQLIEEDLEALDHMYMPWLNDIPKSIAEVVKKALILRTDSRYKNCIEMWLDLKDSLIKEKMGELIPR